MARIGRGGRLTSAVSAAAILAAGGVFAADRYDPRLRFRTIDTPHFAIHYHQGLEATARRLAVVAEEVRAELAARLGVARTARTHVILVDQHDEAGGWATPLPFNTIEISAAPAATADLAGNARDWLRLVFAHEYAHTLHLDRSRGLFGALRRLFGRAPPLLPNLFLPAWQIEGLATYFESAVTGEGRVASGEFRTLVAAAARARRFASLDRVNGGLVAWPGGHAPYAYGAFFHQWLAGQVGETAIAELADRTAARLPYLPHGAVRHAAGAPLERLWAAFRDAVAGRSAAAPADSRSRRLTRHGFVVGRPRWDVGGTAVLYSVRNPHGFPSLVRARVETGALEVLAERFLGEAIGVARDTLIFDQRELVRAVALVSDLFALDRRSGRVIRLTRERRALDPDLAPDGMRVACVIHRGGARLPAVLPLERRGDRMVLGPPVFLDDDASLVYGAPRFSPDGRRLAVERHRSGGPWEIVVFDGLASPPEVAVASAAGRLADPEWLPDNRTILFAWERPGEPFNLFARDIETRDTWRVTALADGARGPAVSPDGATLAYVGYTVEGFDLFVRPLDRAAWSPIDIELSIEDPAIRADVSTDTLSRGGGQRDREPPPGRSVEHGEARAPAQPARAPNPYVPWPALPPRYWLPDVRTREGRTFVGALTSGTDPLGRHRYAARLSYPVRGGSPAWEAAYVYDRWRAAAFVRATQDIGAQQDQPLEERAIEAGVALPIRRVRWSQRALALWRHEQYARGAARADRQALRAGWALTTARRYGYSVSPEHGVTAGWALEYTREPSTRGSATTLTGEIRGYLPAAGRHHVVALRLAAGVSSGAASLRRALGAGGTAAPGDPIAFGRDAVGLIRGYGPGDAVGSRAVAMTGEYRAPLVGIERGIGRWPVFVRQLHWALFADAGHAWTEGFRLDDAKVALGGELSADAVLGYYAPVTFSIGAAWRRDGSGRLPGGGVVFARIGHAF